MEYSYTLYKKFKTPISKFKKMLWQKTVEQKSSNGQMKLADFMLEPNVKISKFLVPFGR